MKDVLSFLDGKKTYLVSIAIIVFNLAIAENWIVVDDQIINAVNAVLVASGLSTLRVGITKK